MRLIVGVSDFYAHTVACTVESIFLSQPGITTAVVFTQKTWCCWSMLLTHNLLLYENRQLATASYRKRRDLNLATPLNISGPSKRGSDALPIKTQLKTQTCTTRLLPWSRFGARQEKGNPENLDLTRCTFFLGREHHACKTCYNEINYPPHTLKDYKVTSVKCVMVTGSRRVECISW